MYLILVDKSRMGERVSDTAGILLLVSNFNLIVKKLATKCSLHLLLGDSNYDRPILDNQSQFIAWAYGPRAVEEGLQDLALFHTEWPRNGGEFVIDIINTANII